MVIRKRWSAIRTRSLTNNPHPPTSAERNDELLAVLQPPIRRPASECGRCSGGRRLRSPSVQHRQVRTEPERRRCRRCQPNEHRHRSGDVERQQREWRRRLAVHPLDGRRHGDCVVNGSADKLTEFDNVQQYQWAATVAAASGRAAIAVTGQ